ncbi:unnamed protein product [Rotaria socialis]
MFLLYGHEQVDAVEQSQTRIINQKKSARYNYQSIVSSKRIVKLFQLWKSRVALALTLCCRPRYAHYSNISQNPSMVYIK